MKKRLLHVLPIVFLAATAGAAFPIADKAVSISFATDGVNGLVGLEDHSVSRTAIAIQRMAPDGSKLGPMVRNGRTGISSTVAFDGNRYLVIWEDDALGTARDVFQVMGQFVNRSGSFVGTPFPISDRNIWFDGIKVMAYGGGSYLVTYTQFTADRTKTFIGGRIVKPDGTMGGKFRISSGRGDMSDVAFDGNRFLVVWTEDGRDREIRGRFVTPEGVVEQEIVVNASVPYSDNPKSVCFDGTAYLVVWCDENAGNRSWDVYGQRVLPDGTLEGGVIPIVTDAGPQLVTSVAYDGINCMAAWIDMSSERDWNLYAQAIAPDGTLKGGRKTISAAPGNQMGGITFAYGRYLALVNHGVEMDENGITAVDACTGAFINPPETRLVGLSGDLAFGNVRTGESAVAWLTLTNRGNRALTVAGIEYPEGVEGDWSGVLGPREGTNVAVSFTPSAVQAYRGMATVLSDCTGGEPAIALSGFGYSEEGPGQIAFVDEAIMAREGEKLYVRVIRACGSTGDASVSYSLRSGTALAGRDYGAANGVLTWTNGESGTKTFKVAIPADLAVEGPETFKAILSSPSGALPGTPSRIAVTIQANKQ